MQKKKKILLGLIVIFAVLLGTTLFVSFSTLLQEDTVVIKSMTPVYDETSGVVVDDNGVVFNDKNQVVKYNVVLENTQNYDVKITDINLTTPTEEFLSYKVEGISTDDVLEANSTKELTISFETMRIEGWGRNFADELTANISFEKQVKQEDVTPPVEEDKEEEKQPEAPATNIEEIVKESEKIEVESITNNTLEFKDGFKVEDTSKVEIWIYPETEFYGYKEVDESKIIKEIVLEKERLDELEITPGEHKIVISTEEEILGYIDIYINEDKEISKEKPQDTTDKEENKPSVNKPSEDKKEDEDGKIENPYTSDKGLLVVLVIATGVTGLAIIIVSKNKFAKYTIFVIALSTSLTLTTGVRAEKTIELPIKLNVSFESQNVMQKSYTTEEICLSEEVYNQETGEHVAEEVCHERTTYLNFWEYKDKIMDIYIENEFKEIKEYVYKFDVSIKEDGRVIAYLVNSKPDSVCYDLDTTGRICYDLHLQADGIIYPNQDASYYFSMEQGASINNLKGIDTSNVTNMSGMFRDMGIYSENLTLDLSNFDTSNVTNMSWMFSFTGRNSENFTLDVSNFDTSNVTDMSYMFSGTGRDSTNLTLDVSDWDTSNVTNMSGMFGGLSSITSVIELNSLDTSKVTDMSYMFCNTGASNSNFTLDLSGFDTSNVTDMSGMFYGIAENAQEVYLNVSSFDTSKVTDMSDMFRDIAPNSSTFTLDISNFDTSNVTNMSVMFYYIASNNENFNLNLGTFDTSNVKEMSYMFQGAGYNSTKLNTSITIKNPNTTSYRSMFEEVATKEGSQITVNYTSKTSSLVDKMIATKTNGANVVKGDLVEIITDDIAVGDEIAIGSEHFNVISQTDDTITMLAQYNIGTDNKQSTTANGMVFADANGWEYTPGPKEIDIQTWGGDTKTLLNNYVSYLQTELGDTTISGDLITLTELKDLGCTIPSAYEYVYSSSSRTCTNSPYKSWLINNQGWWSRSANSSYAYDAWYVNSDGTLLNIYYLNIYGVRPVITISKKTLKNLN